MAGVVATAAVEYFFLKSTMSFGVDHLRDRGNAE